MAITEAPYQLTVLTTSRCTAACAHCSMQSSPERRERLQLGTMTRTIDEIAARGGLDLVIFAGGEPTLLKDDLLEAIAHCDGLGLATRLVTNASWAGTEASARRMIRRLREAGLSELNISADDYHLPYIALANVVRAWKAARGAGFSAVALAACSGPQSTLTADMIAEALGEQPNRRYEGVEENGLPEASEDGTVYLISNARVQRLGVGRGIGNEALEFPHSQQALNTPCHYALRSPALSASGHLVSCCGIEAENNPVLDFGAVGSDGIAPLMARANDDVLVNYVAHVGPKGLLDLLRSWSPDIDQRRRFASVCEVCEFVFSEPAHIELLRQHSAELGLAMALSDVG